MIREHIFSSRTPTDPYFRWRGGDVSRLEGLSDAAFAFAMTMIVVESFRSVDSYAQLIRAMTFVPVFVVCFAILIWIWGTHYRFFRRFGLEDGYTIFLNTALLLTVMVYVYPLKFIFDFVIRRLVFRIPLGPGEPHPMSQADGPTLMQIYSIGFMVIFGLFALMVRHAYKQRERLQLDEFELFLTRMAWRDHLLSASTGVLAITITLVGPLVMPEQIAVGVAGMSYAVNGPLHWWHGNRVKKGLTAIEARLGTPVTDPPG